MLILWYWLYQRRAMLYHIIYDLFLYHDPYFKYLLQTMSTCRMKWKSSVVIIGNWIEQSLLWCRRAVSPSSHSDQCHLCPSTDVLLMHLLMLVAVQHHYSTLIWSIWLIPCPARLMSERHLSPLSSVYVPHQAYLSYDVNDYPWIWIFSLYCASSSAVCLNVSSTHVRTNRRPDIWNVKQAENQDNISSLDVWVKVYKRFVWIEFINRLGG